TYNSFAYRIYDCKGKRTIDNGYKKAYLCDINDLDTIPVNAFLSEALNSFKDYQEKFVKITGKISKISGRDTIELSFYEPEENTLNGHVKFNTASRVRIKTDANLSNLRIYDDFTVIGLVESLTEDKDATIINLTHTILLPSDVYQSYTVEIVENANAEIKKYLKDKEYYLYGLENIYIKYQNDVRYELGYSLTDARIKLEDLIKDIKPEKIKDEQDKELAEIYPKEKYNIYICSNNAVYFVNKKLEFNKDLCIGKG
ncbi:MAG: hypothetical protein K2M17_03620, partial [Bacilli bacterium]|nr:hypothetical protein [Bacilli bacterium]